MAGLRSVATFRSAGVHAGLAAGLFALVLASFGCGDSKDGHVAGTGGATGGADAQGGASAVTGGTAGELATGGIGGSGPRPAQPEWQPPFNLGTQGWRDGTQPNCVQQQGKLDTFGVWADSRGVFTLASFVCDGEGGAACGKEGLSLKYNRGSGWQVYYETQPGEVTSHDLMLSGFRNGSVLLRGVLMGDYGVFSWSNGVLGEPLKLSGPSQWFVADYERAYITDGSDLYEWRGPDIAPFGSVPGEAIALWANDEIIAALVDDQLYVRALLDTDFAPVPDLPPGEYTTIWGFSSKDLWLGNAAGELVHYDGSAFSVLETAALTGHDPAIRELWGSDGDLYFRTEFALGRLLEDSNQPEALLAPKDADDARIHFTGVWGISSSEVFVTLFDSEYAKYECGGLFTLVYDGSEFHEF